MNIDILVSGFGGQGILSLGRILARIAMKEGKHTIWFPSYGAEVRGGTAHCFVRIADRPIASPFIEKADIAIIFNQPSFDKFEPRFKKRSLLIFNKDLSQKEIVRDDLQKLILPLNRIALECDNIKTANIVALGALSAKMPALFKREGAIEVLNETFKNKDILAQNVKAFCKGEKIDVKS
jgi:2-oxoglutarate ferredoxin oxidoreductase subunit gamma